MKKVLIIGGSGTWSGRTYIPSIKQTKMDIYLVGILDPINPYYSQKTIDHFDYFNKHNVKWFRAKRECDKELVKKCISEYDIDIVIISTPPKFHYEYTLVCLESGVDVICDKPIIATPEQSSSINKALVNIEKHHKLMHTICNSQHYKEARRCFVLTPLRRKLQETYTNIYDSVKMIKENYNQNITNICITHNDGVFRFEDEVEIKNGSHGYSEGFGKLTHTGYHILDIVAGLIEFGCNTQDIQCVCKIINCNTVGDMLKSDSNRINEKLLKHNSEAKEVSKIALESEMDITISYTLYYKNKKFCNIIVDLIHCGKSNRIQKQYDCYNYNDQGRTNELSMHIQQGSLFSSQMILSTISNTAGTEGNGYTFKSYHPLVSKKLDLKSVEILNFKKQSTDTTIDYISEFYQLISEGELKGYYVYVDFLRQIITDELYISALIAKNSDCGEYTWKLGKI